MDDESPPLLVSPESKSLSSMPSKILKFGRSLRFLFQTAKNPPADEPDSIVSVRLVSTVVMIFVVVVVVVVVEGGGA